MSRILHEKSNAAVKKVRIRRQLVIPNLLKNYFVLSVNSSSAQPATHQSDVCNSNCDGQYSVYRVCGEDNLDNSSHVISDPSKRASVFAKRADVKVHAPKRKTSRKKNTSTCPLEFINNSPSDCCSSSSKSNTSKKRALSEFSKVVQAYNISSSCDIPNSTTNCTSSHTSNCYSSPFIDLDEINSSETNQSHAYTDTSSCSSFIQTPPTNSILTTATQQHALHTNNCDTKLLHSPQHELTHMPNLLFLQLNVVEFKEEWDRRVDFESSRGMLLLN